MEVVRKVWFESDLGVKVLGFVVGLDVRCEEIEVGESE